VRITKIIIFSILSFFIATNFFLYLNFPDIYTKSKIQFSSLHGNTSYLGRLNFWYLLVQNNDWENAAILESKINSDQVNSYKLSYQPQQLQNKLTQINSQEIKTADDYLQIAKIQSVLGLSSQAIDSIKKAHQLDPIRSDVDRLFYQITQ
jgi:hypothetical protein